MAENKPFHQNLDELIQLFKKIKKNQNKIQFKDIDVTFMDDFEILLNNYDMIKEYVAPEMLDTLGAPIRDLIEGLIIQLRNELEDIVTQANLDELVDETELYNDLVHVNELLKQDNLTVADIDYLLDRRAELLAQQERLQQK